VDSAGATVGSVDALEMVTIGQRKGLGLSGGAAPRYVVDVDTEAATVRVGGADDLNSDFVPLESWRWVDGATQELVEVQTSAHGSTAPARVGSGRLEWLAPRRRVAPGQSVVAFVDDLVVGGGIAGR
jgi:tRNA-specific 2-thiouridylase